MSVLHILFFFFFKQKTAYEMRISDWSSDVCSSDLFTLSTFRNEVPDSLDADMIRDARAVFERGEKMQLTYTVRNTHRAVGTRLSSEIVRRFGMKIGRASCRERVCQYV